MKFFNLFELPFDITVVFDRNFNGFADFRGCRVRFSGYVHQPGIAHFRAFEQLRQRGPGIRQFGLYSGPPFCLFRRPGEPGLRQPTGFHLHNTLFFLKFFIQSIRHQAQPVAGFHEPLIRIVLAQQEPVFRPRGKHPVRLPGILRDEIVDQHADIGLRAIQDQRRVPLDLKGRIDPGHESLGRSLFISRSPVDLPGMIQTLHVFGFEGLMELVRRKVVVFDGIPWLQHGGTFQAGDGLQHGRLHVHRQAGRDAVGVKGRGIQFLGLYKDLVLGFILKPDNLVLDGRAIARPRGIDHPHVHRRTVQIVPDDVMRPFSGIREMTGNLRVRDACRPD